MAKIIVENISKGYKNGQIQALRNLSFQCEDGRFFCLLGPAGAGKTTTVKLIAGIEPADSGKVSLDDQDVTYLEPKDRDVAVAFETYALYPHRTVRENLSFPLEAPMRKKEWPEAAVKERVTQIANLLGIGELLERYPRQLSGGQRQRVALGRALVRKPRAYLLDEPIAHLDAKLRHRMRGELKRIQMELGITMLYTTPDQLEALSLADAIAVINMGQLEQIGTPEEIYKRPANVFVGRFVGDPPMNILQAIIEGDEMVFNGIHLDIPKKVKNALSAVVSGNDVIVGVRPKEIKIHPENSKEALAKAHVAHVQILGETSVATLILDTLELHAKLATQQAPQRGENVSFSFQSADCHFFDVQTQKRIEVL